MNQKTRKVCQCGTLEVLVSDANFTIEFDTSLQEYNLASLDDKVRFRMHFCFYCGNKLPESKRACLFTEPSGKEQKEVVALLGEVTRIEQALRLLGEPDEKLNPPENAEKWGRDSVVNYKHHYRYKSRWQTLDLTVRERQDGSIDYAFTGKHRAE